MLRRHLSCGLWLGFVALWMGFTPETFLEAPASSSGLSGEPEAWLQSEPG